MSKAWDYKDYLKSKKKYLIKKIKNVPIPKGFKVKLKGVGLGIDQKGYYVYTHRARSKSYKDIAKIPLRMIKWIESTG